MIRNNITLNNTTEEDLSILFKIQLDKEGRHLAAFTALDTTDEDSYIKKYARFLNDPTINTQTIKVDSKIVGSIAKFMMNNEAEITYWIDRKYWGIGIAGAALAYFLKLEKSRPIYGRTAFDNYRSQKVLAKCGFVKIGSDKGFANARNAEIEEYIYELLY